MTISLYDVRKLTTAGFTPCEVMDSVQGTIDYWQEIDGAGGTLGYLPGCILVRQTEKAHEEVLVFLKVLEKMTVLPAKAKP